MSKYIIGRELPTGRFSFGDPYATYGEAWAAANQAAREFPGVVYTVFGPIGQVEMRPRYDKVVNYFDKEGEQIRADTKD